MRSGQLFERLWLDSHDIGVTIHPMSQTMRRRELRKAVAKLLPLSGLVPQHLFRVGYSSRKGARHTPRRPLTDVLERPGSNRAYFAANDPSSSANGTAPARRVNVPCSAISLAASRKPVQAARASAPPTLIRRTPASASSAPW